MSRRPSDKAPQAGDEAASQVNTTAAQASSAAPAESSAQPVDDSRAGSPDSGAVVPPRAKSRATKPKKPVDPKSPFQRYGGWIMAMVVFGLAIFAAYRFYTRPEPTLERDGSGAVAAHQNVPIALGQPGDCIESLPQDDKADINKVDFVSCSADHQVVIIAATQTTDTGTTEAAQAAASECIIAAETITGVNPKDASAGYRLTITPPGGSLKTYLCLVDYNPKQAPDLEIPR
ncbi:MAG: hypothetical protein LBV00_07945 [Propionibacteriaceae bacterium]|jgi:hypothetical protein|nr:hypothetical protein [Propionibacteriaceae bacterium]